MERHTVVGDHLMRDATRRLDTDKLTTLQAPCRQAFGQCTGCDAGREDAECDEALRASAQVGHPHPST
jgi:hypothetical protein